MEHQPEPTADIIPFTPRQEDFPKLVGKMIVAQIELTTAIMQNPAGAFGLMCYSRDQHLHTQPDADIIHLDDYRYTDDPA